MTCLPLFPILKRAKENQASVSCHGYPVDKRSHAIIAKKFF